MEEFTTYAQVIAALNAASAATVERNWAIGQFVADRKENHGEALSLIASSIDERLVEVKSQGFYSQCLKVVETFGTLGKARKAGKSWTAIRDACYAKPEASAPLTDRKRADKAVAKLTDAQFKALVRAEAKRRGVTL
jgi:hypothetical protein